MSNNSRRLANILLFVALLACPFLADAAQKCTVTLSSPPGTAVAIVNGATSITNHDVDAYTEARTRGEHVKLNGKQRLAIAKNIISLVLAAQDAKKQGLYDNPDVLAELAMQRDMILANQAVEHFMDNAKVPEDQLKQKYQEYVKSQSGEEYKARHILVKSKAEAEKIIKELNHGANFADLAKKDSTGPSAKKGGELGWFEPQQMVPEFSAALEKLKPGEYTKTPVKSQSGWHVIYLQKMRKSKPASLAVMKPQLEQQIKGKLVNSYLSQLLAKSIVKQNPPKRSYSESKCGTAPPSGKIYASVNGAPISSLMVNAYVLAHTHGRVIKLTNKQRQMVVDQLAQLMAAAEEAENKGYEQMPDVRSEIYIQTLMILANQDIMTVVKRNLTSSARKSERQAYVTNYLKNLRENAWIRWKGHNSPAQLDYEQGERYLEGNGVKQSYVLAVKSFKKAANRNNKYAQFALGNLYEKGEGVAKNDIKAVNLFFKAAEQGNTDGRKALEEKANKGDKYAQLGVGRLFADGKGVTQNYALAAKWYRKAANQGFPPAATQLGELYATGNKGVEKDPDKAIIWLGKAVREGSQNALQDLYYFADQGDPYSQYELGVLYADGRGLPQNDTKAAKWFLIAKAGNTQTISSKATAELSKVEKHMSPNQIGVAQKVAGDWWNRHH